MLNATKQNAKVLCLPHILFSVTGSDQSIRTSAHARELNERRLPSLEYGDQTVSIQSRLARKWRHESAV